MIVRLTEASASSLILSVGLHLKQNHCEDLGKLPKSDPWLSPAQRH